MGDSPVKDSLRRPSDANAPLRGDYHAGVANSRLLLFGDNYYKSLFDF